MSSTVFGQQGQLDWVALSRTGMTCTLDVAARIMNAGLDVCTPLVGRGLCSSFIFPAKGQLLLKDSLDQLRIHHSFGKILEFGFGLKNIVQSLCETEQGALCVSLSAALAIPYTPFQAAQVWREYCLLRGTPANFSPGIHQWARLVDVCAGSLQRSHFQYHFDDFSRKLAPEAPSSNLAAKPEDIAKALATLADLSQGKVSSAVIVGGIECAWLAAVAKCLLCLSIEIHDGGGHCIYQSIQQPGGSIQAIFRPEDQNSSANRSTALVQRTCFVSSGSRLLHERVDFLTSVIRHRSNWSTILSDSFRAWDMFKKSPAAQCFGELFQLVAVQSQDYFYEPSLSTTEEPNFPWWLYWNSEETLVYHPRRTGQSLVDFGYGVFQELQELPGKSNSNRSTSASGTGARMLQILGRIAACCNCAHCGKDQSKGKLRHVPDRGSTCFQRLTLTIIRLILITAPVSIHADIPPSPAAVRQLYICTFGPGQHVRESIPRNGVELVSYLFTGQFSANRNRGAGRKVTALSVGGICVYSSLLTTLKSSPLDVMAIEIIPGHIKHEDRTYKMIADLQEVEDERAISKETLLKRLYDGSLNKEQLRFELIAEETEDTETISVSYRASVPNDFQMWMKLADVQKHLQSCLRFHECPSQGCDAVLQTNKSLHFWSMISNAKSKPLREDGSFGCENGGRWLLLDWHVWRGGVVPPIQRLEIDVYQESDEVLFLLLLSSRNERHLQASGDVSSGSVVIPVLSHSNCVVRTTLSYWPEVSSTIPSAESRLLIRRRYIKPEHPDDELAFHVVTERTKQKEEASRSHRTSWGVFRRKS